MYKVNQYDTPSQKIAKEVEARTIHWGEIVSVDTESQIMKVRIEEIQQTIPVTINNFFTTSGIGFKVMPVARNSIAILLRNGEKFWHIGYALDSANNITDDKKVLKSTGLLLQRHLDEGEVQIVGATGNEILLNNDGHVLVKTKDGSFIKLDSNSDTFEGLFRNLKFEMDGVRIRAGHARRMKRAFTKEEVDMVLDSSDEVKAASKLTKEELEDFIPINEFTVQVGINKDDDGLDNDFDQRSPSSSSPSVGLMAMSNKVLNEKGNPVKILGKDVVFVIRMSNGGGLAVTEDNSTYLLDYRGKNFTKFGGGGQSASAGETSDTESKSLRAGDNNFIDVSKKGVRLQHESRTSLEIKSDQDEKGEMILTNDTGRNITLNKMGVSINMDGAYVSITGKEINLNAEKITLGGPIAATAGDVFFKAKLTAALFDTHVHAGPVGPPIVPWTPVVLSNTITTTGFAAG